MKVMLKTKIRVGTVRDEECTNSLTPYIVSHVHLPLRVSNPSVCFDPGRRVTKAEKRRQKKAKANRDREARIREERSNIKFSARNIEAEKMKKILQERSLKMHEIQPDGNWYALA